MGLVNTIVLIFMVVVLEKSVFQEKCFKVMIRPIFWTAII